MGYSERPMMKDRMKKEFVVPPFSVLDTRQKDWQERVDAWISLGIQSELGRKENMLSMSDKCITKSSVFNPVLCEIMYKWFCPKGGKIFDPFAGGSVRGIVAEYLGYHYTGVELRKEQVDNNIEQSKKIGMNPKWICGDSNKMGVTSSGQYDFVFSCPPYYNLEVYSDIPGELSNTKTYQEFLTSYRSIISKCCQLLNDNRFACFVVSEIRDEKGFYRGFVKDTIQAFEDCGMHFYNEMILVNSIGSLPIRTKTFFVPTRKIGRHHQNILVFYKGDVSKIEPIESDLKIETVDKWL